MRILYVEDNPANLFLVKRVARMGGHEVINYIDGEDALANFVKDKPDLVLMDIQLAGELSGLDVVQNLRTRGHKTPIIAVTAYAMIGDRERFMAAGCDDYLAKPLPIPRLVELIEHYNKATPVMENVPTRRIEPPIITAPIPGITDPQNIRSTTIAPQVKADDSEASKPEQKPEQPAAGTPPAVSPAAEQLTVTPPVAPDAPTKIPGITGTTADAAKRDENPTQASRPSDAPDFKLEPLADDDDADVSTQDTHAMPRTSSNGTAPELKSGELNGKH